MIDLFFIFEEEDLDYFRFPFGIISSRKSQV